MFQKFCPTLEELKPLENNWIFQHNFQRIKRYHDLGLDFMVYGEGKVTLFRTTQAITTEQRRILFTLFNGQCPLCGKVGSPSYTNGYTGYLDDKGELFHIDHIIPISFGGTNDITNLQIICPSCNRKKKESLPNIKTKKG